MIANRDVDILNSLITTTIDSANGFERAAEDSDSGRFRQLFAEFGRERRQVVADLQAAVRAAGGTPNDDGSLKGDLHRRWLDLRDAISGDGDDKAVIEEVERGEDYLKAKYDEALAETDLGTAARDAIATAYESVRAGHERASALKHQMQATSH